MLALNFINEDIAPCLFLKQLGSEFIILALYVDNINIFSIPSLATTTIETLKGVFEMKELGIPNYYLGI